MGFNYLKPLWHTASTKHPCRFGQACTDFSSLVKEYLICSKIYHTVFPRIVSTLTPLYVLLPFNGNGVRNGAISIAQWGLLSDCYKINSIDQWGKIVVCNGVCRFVEALNSFLPWIVSSTKISLLGKNWNLNILQFSNLKTNSFGGNYWRKYGIPFRKKSESSTGFLAK